MRETKTVRIWQLLWFAGLRLNVLQNFEQGYFMTFPYMLSRSLLDLLVFVRYWQDGEMEEVAAERLCLVS